MDEVKQTDITQEVEKSSESVQEETGINLEDIEEVPTQREPLTDFSKFKGEKATIEHAEIVRIPSNYAKAKDGKVHRLKLIGEIVEVVEKKDKDNNPIRIELRPSELINCEEDQDGNFLGMSDGDKSQWTKLKKYLEIQKPTDLKGKKLPMKVTESKTGTKFLGFMYE